jgi:hypothetical protein
MICLLVTLLKIIRTKQIMLQMAIATLVTLYRLSLSLVYERKNIPFTDFGSWISIEL